MLSEYKVFITETVSHAVWVTADSPAEAQRIAEERYDSNGVIDVNFEVEPLSRRNLSDR